jgi:serine/threonine protein kinase
LQRRVASREGQVIDGRYRILAQLGMGGMGHVYAAEHLGLRQRCALKFLHAQIAEQPGAVKRFLREARVLASLRHRNIITVSDVGADAGDAFYVMELLEGEDLRAVLRRERRLPWQRVRVLAIQLAEALAVAHDAGVVHRDMKPENCFLVRGGDELVKILDFGIAKVVAEPGSTKLTGAGETLGTVGYMPPEQCEGEGDRRVDVYALGVVLYEMLAGQPPYAGSSYEIIARLIRRVEPAHLSEICPQVPAAIAAAIHKAMALEPGARFQDMRELLAVLHALPVDGPPHAPAAVPAAIERGGLHATLGVADTVLGAAPLDEPAGPPGRAPQDDATTPGRAVPVSADRPPDSRMDTPDSSFAPSSSETPLEPRQRRGRWIVAGLAAAASLLALAVWRQGPIQTDADERATLAGVTREPSLEREAVRSPPPATDPPVTIQPVDPPPAPGDEAGIPAPESVKRPVLTQPRLKSLVRDALHRAGAASTNGEIEIAINVRVNSKGEVLGLAPRFPNPADWPKARQETARRALAQLLTTREMQRAMRETSAFTIKLMLPSAR